MPTLDDRTRALLEIFGANLKAARLAAEMSQADFAAKTGIHETRLYQIELGRKNLTMSTMVVLADVVGRKVVELL